MPGVRPQSQARLGKAGTVMGMWAGRGRCSGLLAVLLGGYMMLAGDEQENARESARCGSLGSWTAGALLAPGQGSLFSWG